MPPTAADARASRFAGWPRGRALVAAVVLALCLLASAIVTIRTPEAASGAAMWRWMHPAVPAGPAGADGRAGATAKAAFRERVPGMPFERTEPDLALYDVAAARIAHGDNYYRFIVAEQRATNYPVRPALAFRLPTLAWLTARIGPRVMPVLAWVLLAAVFVVWLRRLGAEPLAGPVARRAPAYVLLGAATAFNPYYAALHEVWAGLLVALALGLYRPQGVSGEDRGVRGWLGSWLAFALALAIRELVLPAVLLMAAQALWYRRWAEVAAWGLLIALFGAALAEHLSVLSAQALPTDPAGPGWLALRGLSGWLSDIVMPTPLRFLPHPLAGPLVVLMLLGWIGLRSRFGALIALLLAGYALAFMIAGRWDNFYWGLIVAPVQFAGLAFAPRALADLWRGAFPKAAGGTQTLPRPPRLRQKRRA